LENIKLGVEKRGKNNKRRSEKQNNKKSKKTVKERNE